MSITSRYQRKESKLHPSCMCRGNKHERAEEIASKKRELLMLMSVSIRPIIKCVV